MKTMQNKFITRASVSYKEIDIKVDSVFLKGNLRLKEDSKGIVLFSHGSGSSRMSSRNNYVADYLLKQDFSSLLFDLLTEEEDCNYSNRFDIDLLTKRLVKVTQWVLEQDNIKLPIAYFGASTGAASALRASALLGPTVKAVVSRGGRPDMAIPYLNKVNAPTLLIVGGDDTVVIELNKQAKAVFAGVCELKIVPGASHLFEESGKLEVVSELTCDWFDKYLKK